MLRVNCITAVDIRIDIDVALYARKNLRKFLHVGQNFPDLVAKVVNGVCYAADFTSRARCAMCYFYFEGFKRICHLITL